VLLSEIASDITGTRWNGPLFFGLPAHRTAERGWHRRLGLSPVAGTSRVPPVAADFAGRQSARPAAASCCCRRYRARRLKAFAHDPQLLVIRPAPPPTSLDHLKPFKLSTALMAVHKDCYAPIGRRTLLDDRHAAEAPLHRNLCS
jgi:hypothetical protein